MDFELTEEQQLVRDARDFAERGSCRRRPRATRVRIPRRGVARAGKLGLLGVNVPE